MLADSAPDKALLKQVVTMLALDKNHTIEDAHKLLLLARTAGIVVPGGNS